MVNVHSTIEQVITYVQINSGKWIESPRNNVFGKDKRRHEFKVSINSSKDKIIFEFDSRTSNTGTILALDVSRFLIAVEFLNSKGDFVKIGASTKELGPLDSLEYHLKTETGDNTKTAPHIADLLVLANIAEFGYIVPTSGRKVHGIKLVDSNSVLS